MNVKIYTKLVQYFKTDNLTLLQFEIIPKENSIEAVFRFYQKVDFSSGK